MASPQPPDRRREENLRAELVRQGLPSDYVSRLVEELSDHAADLLRENPSMEANSNLDGRLGSPKEIAAAAGREFRRRTFAGRHPAATFVAGPLVAVVLGLTLNMLLIVAGMWCLDCGAGLLAAIGLIDPAGGFEANDAVQGPPTALEMGMMRVVCGTTRFVPFLAAAWLLARAARRAGLRRWGAAGCGIVAVAAYSYTSVVGQSAADGMGYWMQSFGWQPSFGQVLQAAAPVALAAWMLWRSAGGKGGSPATA